MAIRLINSPSTSVSDSNMEQHMILKSVEFVNYPRIIHRMDFYGLSVDDPQIFTDFPLMFSFISELLTEVEEELITDRSSFSVRVFFAFMIRRLLRLLISK